MLRQTLLSLLIGIGLSASAQKTDEITMRQSQDFETPGRHSINEPVAYGNKGIFQFSNKGAKSVHVQLFGNDLKMIKENTDEIKSSLSEHANNPIIRRMGDKIYLFVRDVYRDTKTEGVSALEFNPETMRFEQKDKKLFESSSRVAFWSSRFFFGTFSFGDLGPYSMNFSKKESKVLFTYRLVPEKRNQKESHDEIGMYVFDQSLNKVWGREIRMPYTEAKMDNLDYAVTDEGIVYLLARVYEGETPREKRSRTAPNYHIEVFRYDGQSADPQIIQIALDGYVPKTARVFETLQGEILVAGFYAKALNKPTDGSFVLSLDETSKKMSLKNGGIFEIPSELIKSFVSSRELRRLERKENRDEENDLGVENLNVRAVYILKDGTIKMLAEEYQVVERTTTTYSRTGSFTTTSYDTYANDIFVINASPDGKYWVRKIPKAQHSRDAYGPELSFNSMVKGNDLYVFFVDNKRNKDLQKDEAPKTHQQGKGGYLTAVKLDALGNETRTYLGEIDEFETNFYIRYFVDGDQDNLIYTARRRRKNSLISIDMH